MDIVSLHLLTLFLTVLVILYSDHQGLLYFLGKKQTLSKEFITWSHTLVWLGLMGMITTGVFLLLPAWTYRLQEPIFYVKMGFVLVLVVNAFAIGKLSHVAHERSFNELQSEEKRTLLLSGFLSFTSWVGAWFIGFFLL